MNDDFINFINSKLEKSNGNFDELVDELRKENKKLVCEQRGVLVDFLQADRHKIIMKHQTAGMGNPDYLDSEKYKNSIDLALKLSQLIRLMLEEEQF